MIDAFERAIIDGAAAALRRGAAKRRERAKMNSTHTQDAWGNPVVIVTGEGAVDLVVAEMFEDAANEVEKIGE